MRFCSRQLRMQGSVLSGGKDFLHHNRKFISRYGLDKYREIYHGQP